MGSDVQIIIVGTGYYGSGDINDYYGTVRYNYDKPAIVIRRDGSIEKTPLGGGHTMAIENAGPVVQGTTGLWLPARMDAEGKYRPITRAYPVKAPYEFCSCKPYHGCQHYEYVGDKQLATMKEVLQQWLSEMGFRYPWDNQLGVVCPRAVAGKSGVYFASSFDRSRSDIHPQREIIDIIKAYSK